MQHYIITTKKRNSAIKTTKETQPRIKTTKETQPRIKPQIYKVRSANCTV